MRTLPLPRIIAIGDSRSQNAMDPVGQLTTALAGRYTIERELGAGGMATVYLAHDVRHDRRVALKLLRPELAAVIGAERFLREIRTTANLQHPHILPLFDSGEAGSQLFYVMPLIEGESLRDRLDREKQLGVEESVRIASEVAAALDYAHRHGVVHRDVKPANILLHDGSALVTDFGIALAIRNAGADRITETGLSLGTPHYMSPEQATGDRDIGARSDVYSLAAVLYEMLAGEPPHSGGTIQAVIAKVLTETPRPLGVLRSSVPVHVALAVEQALAKVPADRFATAAEFAEALKHSAFTSARARATPAATRAATSGRPSWLAASLAIGALAAGALGGWMLHRPPRTDGPSVIRFEVSPDSGLRLQDRPAVSPDGIMIVYNARDGSGSALYLRRLDEMVSRKLAGTENGYGPFFSPDGKSIGFVANNQLHTLRLDGGAPVNVARIGAVFLGATWDPGNTIIFSQFPPGLYRVSPSGGAAERLPLPDTSAAFFWPSTVPGGGAVLLTEVQSSGEASLGLYDLHDHSLRRLGPGFGPQFVAPHWIVFGTEDGQLYRQRFDPRALDTVATRQPVMSGLRVENNGLPLFAAAPNGTVATMTRASQLSSLILLDRSANERELLTGSGVWAPRFSPNGQRLAYGLIATGKTNNDVWLYDMASRASQRLTFEGDDSNDPSWSADGRFILFSSNRDSATKDLFVQPVDGTGGVRRVLRREGIQYNSDWSRDGQVIVFTDVAPDSTRWNIWSVRTDDTASAKPFLMSPFQETGARLSPDGKWIAYHSNETGRFEVYVQSFPTPGHKTLISTDGGRDAIWGNDGRTLYYWRSIDLMVASVTLGAGALAIGKPERLFEYPDYLTGVHANYDVSPDGRSFAVVSGGPTANRITISLNLIR